MRLKNPLLLLFVVLVLFVFNACSPDDDKITLSSEKDILSFVIPGVETKIDGTTIVVTFPSTQSNYRLTPEVKISEGASIFPQVSVNFEDNNLTFEVTAEDGSKKVYTVVVNKAAGLQSVFMQVVFLIGDEKHVHNNYPGVIDSEKKTITINMPKSLFDNSHYFYFHLKTTVSGTIDYATIPNENQDVSKDLNEYQFIDYGNNTSDKYTVKIVNTQINIDDINFPIRKFDMAHFNAAQKVYEKYTEGLNEDDIVVFTFEDQDITNVLPTMTLSEGATVTPSLDIPVDFSNDVQFTITSENGENTETRTIRVVKKKLLLDYEHNRIMIDGIRNLNEHTIHYDAISPVVGGYFTDRESDEEYKIATVNKPPYTTNSGYYHKLILEKPLQPKRDYTFTAILENGDIVVTDKKFETY